MNALRSIVVLSCFLLLFGIVTASAGEKTQTKKDVVPGQPFESLQQQIDELKAMIGGTQINGGVHVYDDNGQYLGICIDRTTAFNSDLNLFIPINATPVDDKYGYPRDFMQNIDDSGNTLLQTKDTLFRLCDGTYVVAIGEGFYYSSSSWLDSDCNQIDWEFGGHISGWFYNYEEILVDDLPFTFPFAMPLHYSTQGPTE